MKEQNNQTLRLRVETIENLHIFSEILKKSPEQIIEEALSRCLLRTGSKRADGEKPDG